MEYPKEKFAQEMHDLWKRCAADDFIVKAHCKTWGFTEEEMSRAFELAAVKTLNADDPFRTDILAEAIKEVLGAKAPAERK